MSKDKGTKNLKKAPADRSTGKGKAVSAYKAEGKSGKANPTLEAFVPKADVKSGGNHKN
ncbi:MAG: hypothetical protein IPL65_22645 [Lewinellaceae bacterium]|nr:hypothetical protein [Lewinellaceae bacterium]